MYDGCSSAVQSLDSVSLLKYERCYATAADQTICQHRRTPVVWIDLSALYINPPLCSYVMLMVRIRPASPVSVNVSIYPYTITKCQYIVPLLLAVMIFSHIYFPLTFRLYDSGPWPDWGPPWISQCSAVSGVLVSGCESVG